MLSAAKISREKGGAGGGGGGGGQKWPIFTPGYLFRAVNFLLAKTMCVGDY